MSELNAAGQILLLGAQQVSAKGVANGYASLGADGLVPDAQLPARTWAEKQAQYLIAAAGFTNAGGFVDDLSPFDSTIRWQVILQQNGATVLASTTVGGGVVNIKVGQNQANCKGSFKYRATTSPPYIGGATEKFAAAFRFKMPQGQFGTNGYAYMGSMPTAENQGFFIGAEPATDATYFVGYVGAFNSGISTVAVNNTTNTGLIWYDGSTTTKFAFNGESPVSIGSGQYPTGAHYPSFLSADPNASERNIAIQSVMFLWEMG